MTDLASPTLTDSSPATVSASAPPTLRDAWPWAVPMPLTGWLERNGFTPVWTALVVLVLAFLLFQVVVAPIVLAIGIAIRAAQSGATEAPGVAEMLQQVQQDAPLLMTANTVGQILGFGLFAWFAARRHTPQAASYLRLRRPDGPGFALAAVGWLVLVPAIAWTGQLNEMIPLPEFLKDWETMQTDLIEGLLVGGELSTVAQFVALALTPAICEELLFRGYLLRGVERRFGSAVAIVAIGVIFGAYHLRASQLIPLSLLGVYLGYVVWATGSLWSGVLVHLLNNGFVVVLSSVARAGAAQEGAPVTTESLEAMSMPWYFGVAGLALAAGVAVALYRRRRAVVDDQPDAVLDARTRPTFPLSPSPVLR